MSDLLNDLKNVPKNAAVRKVNELVKRVRLCKAHSHIIGHLKKEMPSMWGKEKAQVCDARRRVLPVRLASASCLCVRGALRLSLIHI